MKLFEIAPEVQITPVAPREYEPVLEVCRKALGPYASRGMIDGICGWALKNNQSVKLTLDGKVIGAYVLSDRTSLMDCISSGFSAREFAIPKEEIDWLKSHKGIQGVALAVDPEYKSQGYGKMLIDYSLKLPYDYIWGLQQSNLNNLQHWLKRRKLVAQSPGMNVTYARLR